MGKASDQELIRALRCSCSTLPDDCTCKECPYSFIETWNNEEIQSCDVDRIGMDAAARLAELTGE